MPPKHPQPLPALAHIISAGSYTWITEDDLQAGIAETLKAAGIDATREVALSGGLGRVDFMVGATAIEVKIKGSWQALTRQVMRYSHAPEVKTILVVSTKAAHAQNVPVEANGVPILTIFLNGAF